MASQS
ncbi:hypothetical protein YPPY60_2142, partial [Yersinia pestis PY-60]